MSISTSNDIPYLHCDLSQNCTQSVFCPSANNLSTMGKQLNESVFACENGQHPLLKASLFCTRTLCAHERLQIKKSFWFLACLYKSSLALLIIFEGSFASLSVDASQLQSSSSPQHFPITTDYNLGLKACRILDVPPS